MAFSYSTFWTHQQTKVTQDELKARSDVLGPRLTYVPRPTLSIMGHLGRGEGVPHPGPYPLLGTPMPLVGDWSLPPSHVTFFLYKKRHVFYVR